jgi:hypothetical protein
MEWRCNESRNRNPEKNSQVPEDHVGEIRHPRWKEDLTELNREKNGKADQGSKKDL